MQRKILRKPGGPKNSIATPKRVWLYCELDICGAVENTLIATEVREVVALKLTKVQNIFSFVLYRQKKEQFTFTFLFI